MQHDHSSTDGPGRGDRLRTISRLVFFGFVAVAAYFLVTEHRAHLFGYLPFLLLLACPLLHMFHHRGHGDRDEPGRSDGGTHQH